MRTTKEKINFVLKEKYGTDNLDAIEDLDVMRKELRELRQKQEHEARTELAKQNAAVDAYNASKPWYAAKREHLILKCDDIYSGYLMHQMQQLQDEVILHSAWRKKWNIN